MFFPGGYGTLDEFFEIVTLLQTRKIENVPLILVGSEFWNKVDTFIKDVLLNEYKAIDPIDTTYYTITDDEDEILEIVKKAPLREE
jgi:predicted Rossmann-fold nucleotide-binding protein